MGGFREENGRIVWRQQWEARRTPTPPPAQCYEKNYKNCIPAINLDILHCPRSFLSGTLSLVALYICLLSACTVLPLNRHRTHPYTFFRPVLVCDLHTRAFLGRSRMAGALLPIPSPRYIPPLLNLFYTAFIIFWHNDIFHWFVPFDKHLSSRNAWTSDCFVHCCILHG